MFDYSEYCNEKLFKRFPELKQIEHYRDVFTDHYKDPEHGAHSIYEDAFCYYILDLIQQGYGRNKIKIDQAFDLIEELVQHKDFEVRCVAEVSFIEPLLDKIKPMKEAKKYLRPHSLKAAEEVGQQRFGLNPKTWELDR